MRIPHKSETLLCSVGALGSIFYTSCMVDSSQWSLQPRRLGPTTRNRHHAFLSISQTRGWETEVTERSTGRILGESNIPCTQQAVTMMARVYSLSIANVCFETSGDGDALGCDGEREKGGGGRWWEQKSHARCDDETAAGTWLAGENDRISRVA